MRTDRPKKRGKGSRGAGTLLVACPICGAGIGQRCQAPDSVRHVATHRGRIGAYTSARKAGLLPETVPILRTLADRVNERGPFDDDQRARIQANIRKELHR